MNQFSPDQKQVIRSAIYFECETNIPDLCRPFYAKWERRSRNYISIGSKRKNDPHAIFHYCLSGRGCVRYKEKTYDVLPGSGFLGAIDEIDYFYPENGTEEWQFVWFGYRGGIFRELTHSLVDKYGPVFQLPLDDLFIAKLNMLESRNRVRLNAFQASALVFELFGALEKQKQRDIFSTLPEPVCKTIVRIRESKTVPSIKELADSSGLSREHLSRIFRNSMDCTLQMFLKDHCNELTKKLLLTTSLSIEEIASRCSYQSESAFIRMFRKKNHITPEKFRISAVNSQTFPD